MFNGSMTTRGHFSGRQSVSRGTADFRSLQIITVPDARPHESAPEMRGTVPDRARRRRKSSGSTQPRTEKPIERSRPRAKDESSPRSRPMEHEATRGRSRPILKERLHVPEEPQRQETQVSLRAAKGGLVQDRPVLSIANSTPVGKPKWQLREAAPLQQAPLAGERPTGPKPGGQADAPSVLAAKKRKRTQKVSKRDNLEEVRPAPSCGPNERCRL